MHPHACIVTTLRNAEQVLDTFINYHLDIGFKHLFLFLDDPNEVIIENNFPKEKVTYIKNDDYLKKLWKETKMYEQLSSFILSEVMARQILNTEVAIKMALEDDYDWILHIDVDELFMLEGYENVCEHFKDLEKNKYEVVQYFNHEGVPEKYEIGNYFKEVTLFKRNIQVLTASQKEVLLQTVGSFQAHFRFYKNGKAAAKLHNNLVPVGVHSFLGQTTLHLDTLTCILHYPCCGFQHFVRKYKSLGAFNDKWFKQDEISRKLPAHFFSRNIIQTNDMELVNRFYSAVFMQQGNGQIEYLLQNEIYFRAHPLYNTIN